MRDCRKCGSPNPDQVSICDHCGAKLEPATILSDVERREAIQALQRPVPRQSISILAMIALALSLFSPFPSIVVHESVFRPSDVLLSGLVVTLLPLLVSIISRILIGDEGGRLRGIKLANTAITLSIILPLLTWIFVIPLMPRHSKGPTCTSNQRQLAMAMLMFAQENEELLPGKPGITPWSTDAEKQQWRVIDVQGLAAGVFNCTSSPLSGAPGPATAKYAMNADVMGAYLGQIPLPYATLLTADTKGTDAIFSAGNIDRRHNGGFIASFGDGHVAFFPSTVSTADPQQTPLQTGSNTAFDYNAPGIPAVNPFIIQGAMNVIEVTESKSWNSQPCCTIHRGKKLTTYIGDKGYCGNYLTVYYSQMPSESQTPLNLPIGAFVNGTAEDYTAKKPAGIPPYGVQATKNLLTVPAAGGKYGVFTTFWLPPVIGSDKSGRRYSHYNISGGPAGTVSITPAY